MPRLNIIFMGTTELARTSLEALSRDDSLHIATVVTQPDRPKGRHLKPQFSPVKEMALAADLPLLQPERARSEDFIAQLKELQPDLIAVAAYGQILPPSILDTPRFGCINVHASLLPKYRGAAPIQWAILNDEVETGVTIMKMNAGLDTGDMLTRVTTPVRPEDDARTLQDRLAQLGAELLVRTIPDYVSGKIAPRPQPSSGVSYARKITREDGCMDWSQPARALWNRVRALAPWPGAYTLFSEEGRPRLLKLWSAKIDDSSGEPGRVLSADKTGIVVGCGRQALRILILQLESGRRLTTQEFLAGHELKAGRRFGD